METSVRNLRELGVETDTYGSLLISIIFDRIPEELRVIISRQFKGANWDLDNLIIIFKEELFAWERCKALSNPDKSPENPLLEEKPFTMFVNSNQSTCCAYCGKNDYFSTPCSKITDVNLRKNHLRKTGRCFICLNKGHLARDCKVKYSCIKCKQRHNVSICSKSKQEAEAA